ncbi:hypothetical protein F3Y22_tig00007387pilonHSYRG00016 [Hibiscus syriacus]|uniref:MULE transposase domain-containing protein n=1 Tax=Hibiscus syriacus TaxID=106335 RepID=A0A6A3CC33_HIBSY|nr:hypothetical protein F3Y22_tig00007387pilonHSYRG00016 [Hibiscus syriacus]
MLNYWVIYGFEDIYVEHEVDTPIIVDDILRITTGEGVDDCAAERVVENVIDADGLDDIGDATEQGEGGIDAGGGGEGVYLTENTSEDDEDNDKKIKGKKHDKENDSGSIENDTEIHDETVDGEGNNGVTEGVGGNDTDYYNNDDHGSLIRTGYKCITSKSYPWRIYVSKNKMAESLQIKTFIDEHNFPASFSNGMVTAKRGWKEDCRPITGLDGYFLKGPFKGILLSIVGRDGNEQMYPIAWAVVEGESIYSWSCFISIVAVDLGLDDGFGYTIINDQHKCIKIVVNDVLPLVEHQNCTRHVFANWIRKKIAKAYQFAFWKIVKSTTEREWEENKDALSKIDSILATELFSKKEKIWIKAFQMMHAKSDIMDNNLCEAFNSSIVDARYKSIITMLEEIRVEIMTRIVEKRKFLTTWKYNFGPLIKKKFNIMKKNNIKWRMIWNGGNVCEMMSVLNR